MNRSQFASLKSSSSHLVWVAREVSLDMTKSHQPQSAVRFAPLQPLRQWLDSVEIHSISTAKALCQVIPAQCPFERTVKLFGHTLFHIPPLCKLNPLYEQVVGLRFRALCYLADECGEDISHYC